jgi:transcriptional regulator with XRE-family HTH domain
VSIHQQFGENLRTLCYNYASISDVCKGIDINRQQFNKYLAGQCLPNALTLRKICGFLKVREEELLGAQQASSIVQQRAVQELENLSTLSTCLQNLSEGRLLTSGDAVRDGYYYCYFPLQPSTNFLMRSVVRIWSRSNLKFFTRITVFPSASGSSHYLARGKHRGVVIANSQNICLLGTNRHPPYQVSFIAFDRENAECYRPLSGMAITKTGGGQSAMRVCLQYLGPKIAIRPLLTTLGPVSMDDANLDRVVLALMAANASDSGNQIAETNVDQILTNVASRMPAAVAHSIASLGVGR